MSYEAWAIIEGYDYEYRVSTEGKVVNVSTGNTLKPVNKDGNLHVQMIKDGKHITKAIAKLVAIAFIPNPDGYDKAYHISDDCLNNCVENIAWGTSRDIRKAHSKLSVNAGSCITALTLDGLYKGTWGSISQASSATGVSESCIRRVLTGIRNTSGGLQWAYTTRMQAPTVRMYKCKCCGQLKPKESFDSIPTIKYFGKYKIYDSDPICSECSDVF